MTQNSNAPMDAILVPHAKKDVRAPGVVHLDSRCNAAIRATTTRSCTVTDFLPEFRVLLDDGDQYILCRTCGNGYGR